MKNLIPVNLPVPRDISNRLLKTVRWPHNSDMSQKQVKTVSLILGSGGARGLAHIGVIQELLSSDYQIQSIYPADVTIEIARNACGTLEFERAAEMIALGSEKTRSRFKSLDGCE